MSQNRKFLGFSGLVVATVVAVTLAGCSSSGSPSSTGTGSNSGNNTGSIVSDTTLTQADLNLALTYTGGTAGKADSSKTPVTIGSINVDGGQLAFPQATNAAKIAVQFINDHAGGIDGHPLDIKTCNIVQGDADAQKCAQQFVNDPSITAITTGMTVLGTGAMYTAVAGKKPIFGKEAFNPADLNQKNVTYLQSGAYTTAPGVLAYASQYLHAKTIAMVYDAHDAGAEDAAQVISTLTAQYGIKVKQVGAADSSQWGAALLSAGAQSADAIFIAGATPVCVPAAQAVTADGLDSKPVIAYDFCEDQSVATALGDFPKWTYLSTTQSAMRGLDNNDTQLYNAIQNTYSPTADRSGGAQGVVGTVFALAHVLNGLGYDKLSDVNAVSQAAAAYPGPVFMAAKSIKCGQYAQYNAPTICSTTVFPVNYTGGGKWVDPTNGQGIDTQGVALKVAASPK